MTARLGGLPGMHAVAVYTCKACGEYALDRRLLPMFLEPLKRTDPSRVQQIPAVLFARRVDGLPPPFLFSGSDSPPSDQGFLPLSVVDLLAQWPAMVADQINRCLINLCRLSSTPGHKVVFHDQESNAFLFLSTEAQQWAWFANTLVNQELIERHASPSHSFTVAAKGWERFNELTRDESNRANPAFVAMWFGGKKTEDRSRQDVLFKEIGAICNMTGWLADRSDGLEHNVSIIDKILFMIRRSPFVIADLSDQNHGAYYEAGFA